MDLLVYNYCVSTPEPFCYRINIDVREKVGIWLGFGQYRVQNLVETPKMLAEVFRSFSQFSKKMLR